MPSNNAMSAIYGSLGSLHENKAVTDVLFGSLEFQECQGCQHCQYMANGILASYKFSRRYLM